MNNNHPEVITIKVGNQERTLKLGPAAFRIAEVKHDIRFTMGQLTDPSLATLAQIAYIGCLVDEPNLKEMKFLLDMAKSDEGAILGAVAEALNRMTEGLTAFGKEDGEPGE